MRSLDDLLQLECPEMIEAIGQAIGKELTMTQRIEIAMLSGAYKAGGGSVLYLDLQGPAREVSFPDYLKALGYPLDGQPKASDGSGERV